MEAGGAWLSSGGFKLSLSILESDHVAEMRAEKKRRKEGREGGRRKEERIKPGVTTRKDKYYSAS